MTDRLGHVFEVVVPGRVPGYRSLMRLSPSKPIMKIAALLVIFVTTGQRPLPGQFLESGPVEHTGEGISGGLPMQVPHWC